MVGTAVGSRTYSSSFSGGVFSQQRTILCYIIQRRKNALLIFRRANVDGGGGQGQRFLPRIFNHSSNYSCYTFALVGERIFLLFARLACLCRDGKKMAAEFFVSPTKNTYLQRNHPYITFIIKWNSIVYPLRHPMSLLLRVLWCFVRRRIYQVASYVQVNFLPTSIFNSLCTKLVVINIVAV